jgi:hypothetical protein
MNASELPIRPFPPVAANPPMTASMSPASFEFELNGLDAERGGGRQERLQVLGAARRARPPG